MSVPAAIPFPLLTRFEDIADERAYQPVPDGWVVGTADVVDSTAAIAAGRYKAVNMAGAAVIAAMSNALGGARFPFAFGGDGAAFAVPPEAEAAARSALAQTAAFVAEEFALELRVGLVPVAAIRAAGFDIRVAQFAASPDLTYAMFSGGGLAWAEEQLKLGGFALSPAPAGSRPDLSGLTCRFEPAPSRRGIVLSIIARRMPGAGRPEFAALVRDILRLIEASPDSARPIPDEAPPLRWPPSGLELEARTRRQPGSSLRLETVRTLARTALSTLVFRLGLPLGRFRPQRYLDQLVANTDYRKYDDGLRMTIDCAPDLAEAIERRLATAEAEGGVAYGLHRQDAALMTCITPSIHRSDHVHFVDGAGGGYAAAALRLKGG
ncbi:MAG: hypothetical protein JWQ36_2939 [Enterovirga sp.]|nr:hypothetical protein [Enterovirga sp.]